MPTVPFGGSGGNAYTAYQLSSGPIPMPTGRKMASGSTGVLLKLDSVNVTGSYTASLAGSTGGYVAGISGGTANLIVTPSGTVHFGRGGSGVTNDGHGIVNYSGTIGGSYTWLQSPSAPGFSSLTSSATGTLSYVFTAPSDNGGSAVTSYALQYSVNSNFTGATTITPSGSGSGTISGLAPGLSYFVRIAARNAVTAAYSTYGPWSVVKTAQVLGGLRIGVSSAWVDGSAFAGVNGAWKPGQVFVCEGGAWVPLVN